MIYIFKSSGSTKNTGQVISFHCKFYKLKATQFIRQLTDKLRNNISFSVRFLLKYATLMLALKSQLFQELSGMVIEIAYRLQKNF